jgi:hypothetical protein
MPQALFVSGQIGTALDDLDKSEVNREGDCEDLQRKERRHHMKDSRKNALVAVLVAGLIAFGVMPVLAQDKPADNMQIVREKVRADKKLFVAKNMELTEVEAKSFWPVYEKYQDELFLLRSRTAKMIREYAEAYKDMSDEKATGLLNEFIKIEGLGAKVKKAYLPKFQQVLPAKKVVRYYQLENKIQFSLYYELATLIPLVQ